MPKELDTGGRFGEKLKRGVTGLRKELKKGMTQVRFGRVFPLLLFLHLASLL